MPEELNVRKQTDAIDKQEKALARMKEEIKANCEHTKNGDLQLVPGNKQSDGELVYICKKCRKVIRLTKISEEELTRACDIIDSACDIIKISLDLNREDDQKVSKRIAKTQFRVRNEIAALYGASLKKGKRSGGGHNNNNNNNEYSSAWDRPKVNGRS